MTPVPRSFYSTESFAPAERFGAWQDSMGVLFDISPTDATGKADFYAQVECFQIDKMLVAQTCSRAARYDRKESRIRKDGLDLVMVQLFLDGEVQFGARRGSSLVNTGQMVVFDMGQYLENFNSEYNNLTLAFPRELAEQAVPGIANWHGRVVPEDRAASRMLRTIFQSTFTHAPQLDVSEAAQVQNATLSLLAAALNPLGKAMTEAEQSTTVLGSAIKQFIRRELASSNLCVEHICAELGVSRSQLYRQMEAYGGVAEYIRQQRLLRAYRDLCDPGFVGLSIAEIAGRWGFDHSSTFTRRFRQEFGVTPRELRSRAGAQPFFQHLARFNETNAATASYEAWLTGLSA